MAISDTSLIRLTPEGLYCAAGNFHIDPWRAVDYAVTTHAHSDHVRWGSARYLTSSDGETVLRARLGPAASISTIPYSEVRTINGVRLSLHPAGHILGAAQVRVEYQGEVWVVSGDYKVEADLTTASFEPIRCHTFITESTFGLPIYRWPTPAVIFDQINAWWRANQIAKRASILYGYALGKAQRMLAGIDASIGSIYTHGAVEKFNQAYRAAGVALPPTIPVWQAGKVDWSQALIVAPPSAHGSPWERKFGAHSAAFASGWMRIRGTRRRRAVDRGFVLSDHADWPGLLSTIKATGAEQIGVTHGYTAVLSRWLLDQGLAAWIVPTRFGDDAELETEAAEPDSADTAENTP